MSSSIIRNLFQSEMQAYALTKNIPVVFENVTEPQDTQTTYLDLSLLPSPTRSLTLGGDHTKYAGIFQITIVAATGTATMETDSIIEDLFSLFRVNKTFEHLSGFKVQVITPLSSDAGRIINRRWVIPCYFEYRSDIN